MNEIRTVRTGPNHALHLMLTIFTCGLWGIVWLIIAANNPKRVPVPQVVTAEPNPAIRPVGPHTWPEPGLYDVTQPSGQVIRGHFNGTTWS